MMFPALVISPLVKYGIAIGVFAGLVIGIYWKGHSDGSAAIRAEILEIDNKMAGAADEARARVDRCFFLGGVWDAARGICRSSVPRLP